MGLALCLASAHNATSAQCPKLRSNNRPLAVAIGIIAVNDNPIADHVEFMGASRVGIEGGVVGVAALRVQNGEPRFIRRVKATWGNEW